MRFLRKMQKGMPDERGRYGQFKKQGKRDRMHFVYGMRQELS